MKIQLPELCLVVLMGASGSGKSSFARRHFRATEILSSDFYRGLVADDETAQGASKDAFDVLRYVAGKRLARGLLTVVDATNVQEEARRPLVALAREYDVLPTAIVLQLPDALCHERNRQRPDRAFGPHVVRQHNQQLRRSLRGLQREGFRHVFVLNKVETIDNVTIERMAVWNNKKSEHGPFDIIGDVHGCCSELEELLGSLGYVLEPGGSYQHPAGRKVLFVGDLVDRGPRILDTLNLVQGMIRAGTALCVAGNHDVKLARALRGKQVEVRHGLDRSLAEVEALPEPVRSETRDQLIGFLEGLVSHYVLDEGRLVVAHAGIKEPYQGRTSGRVRDFCLYGETTGETDAFGLPVRHNWAAEYRGAAMVVYGHTPVPEPEWLNNTLNVDTGCVFGGRLTALRYPEKVQVSVLAREAYAESIRPLAPAPALLTVQQQNDDVLDLSEVTGKRHLHTRLFQAINVREEQTTAALEVMSRFAVNPRWLIYLPPTMAPCATSTRPGLLEHPEEAFAAFREAGASRLICQEKHMGSRAIVVLCRDEAVATRRFGVLGEGFGVITTRTGRRFFNDLTLEAALLERLQASVTRAGLWHSLDTDWLCLDCELMPWSAKAQELLRDQYAPVGSAARATTNAVLPLLEQARGRGLAVESLSTNWGARRDAVEAYIRAYRHYCWPVTSVADLRLAPFHMMASHNAVHSNRDHLWHMNHIQTLVEAGAAVGCPLQSTHFQLVDLDSQESQSAAIAWWEELTATGGEGMVVKPLDFVLQGRRGLEQPAIKVRGPEYLRIIYGPEYRLEGNLEQLRSRRLGAKRSLALREFALGIESLERFVRGAPLRQVHECIFAILALESEPVDPRL